MLVGVEGENRNKLELVNCQYLTLILTITVSLSVSEALNLTDNPVVLFTFKRLLPLYPNNQHCKCEIIMIQLFGRKVASMKRFHLVILKDALKETPVPPSEDHVRRPAEHLCLSSLQ